MHLYLHIPFCRQACYYCDFHFSTNLQLKDKLIDAICEEIIVQKDFLRNKKLQTVYFGAGTPSFLENKDLDKIFETISKNFDLTEVEEITLETNPEDVQIDKIKHWKTLGINRLSLGIQTFDDRILGYFNRNHKAEISIKALDLLLGAEYSNLTVDLIYAHNVLELNEKESNLILFKDLEIISGFNLPHISAYNLTLEKDTVFGKWLKQKKMKAISEEHAATQYEILVNFLSDKKYIQYEVSNFGFEGKFAIHNSAYWKDEEYLGIGPSAHSYDCKNRMSNVANNPKYIKAIESGLVPSIVEELSNSDRINDYLLTGLRTIWGVDLKKISQMAGEIPQTFWDNISLLKNKNWIAQEAETISITSEGRIFSDRIASDLFFD
ncbi:MAG: radical SAM family heme chaperone HemW [Cytophagaceae bacterium]|nr:radical SAM family heme chaperone HemW [Cytophagaceae bacterium]